MTRLLVSVRSADEAEAAWRGGADLIDLKEPRHGALGRCDADVWSQVAQRLAGRSTLSAALGELLSDGPWDSLIAEPALRSFRYVKVGLAGCSKRAGWNSDWQRIQRNLPTGMHLVTVCYLDSAAAQSPPPEVLTDFTRDVGCDTILFDTYYKQRGLFAHRGETELGKLIMRARSMGLTTVLAGSIDLTSLDAALELCPDLIAVRGGVCRGGREGTVDPTLVQQFAERTRVNREDDAVPEKQPGNDLSWSGLRNEV